MKQILFILILFDLTVFSACGQSSEIDKKHYSNISDSHSKDTLFRIFNGELYELGVPCGYVNQKGDTVIPIGKYFYCFLDTVTTYAIVADTGQEAPVAYAIDLNEIRLYEVYWYDNGPDYVREGLFRIKRNGKIGYANTNGKIAIEPQFDCANQFQNGMAKVTYDCELVKDGEYILMKSDSWFYIDKQGKKIK